MEKKNETAMIIDSSVIKNMIEDNNTESAVDLLKKFKEIEEEDKKKLWIFTSNASLLRAIFLADPAKFKLQNLQRLISCVTILHSIANFKDEKAVIDELIVFAKTLSGGKNE